MINMGIQGIQGIHENGHSITIIHDCYMKQ